jgi:hypothetical protein
MKCRLLSLLASGVLCLLVPAIALAQPLPVKTVEFQSDSVGRKMKYNIVLPAKYDLENKIPFTYAESGGAHNGLYWTREVRHSMAVQYALMHRNMTAARPAEGVKGKE